MKAEITMERFKRIEVEVDTMDKTVSFNGNFSLPDPKHFHTEEEATAFFQGVKWAVEYYGGKVTIS